MRIPTSVVVMSVVTAVPFGLGIHEAMTTKQVSPLDEYALDEKAAAAEEAAYEAELARQAAEQAENRAKALAHVETVFAPEKAALGTKFASLALGEPMSEAGSALVETINDDDSPISVKVHTHDTTDTGRLLALQIDITDFEEDGPCEQLRAKLVAAWGPPLDGTWFDPTTRRRALLVDESSECSLTFMQAVDAAAWVAALPFDQIGKPIAALRAEHGGDESEDSVAWPLPGVGYGGAWTEVTAYPSEANKIETVIAMTTADFDTLVAIRETITAKLGQPTRDEDTGAWRWKKKPGAALREDGGNMFWLTIGKDPDQ